MSTEDTGDKPFSTQIERLNEKNYRSWQTQVRAVLLHQKASFPEYHIGPEEIPNIGWIHGNLDFAVAKVLVEDGDTIENIMLKQADKGGQYLTVDHPLFSVLECKGSSLKKAASEAELLGQLRTLMNQYSEESRTGVLTDGYNWTFYLLDKTFGMYQSTFSAGSSQNRLDILAVLTLMCDGFIPKFPDECDGLKRD